MADRQWISNFGFGILEEGNEQFILNSGIAISEDQEVVTVKPIAMMLGL